MNIDLETLLDQSRIENAELRQLERQRVALHCEPECAGRDYAIIEVDKRISKLDSSRIKLLHDIARQVRGYDAALRLAIKEGYDPASSTARFNQRTGNFTFGLHDGTILEVKSP